MSYEFIALTAANEPDPHVAISRVLKAIDGVSAVSSTVGDPPHVWASVEVARPAAHDSVLIEMHSANDQTLLHEVDRLSSLGSAPDLAWVRGLWIFTLAGNADVALAQAVVRVLSARQRTQLYDERSGFELRIN